MNGDFKDDLVSVNTTGIQIGYQVQNGFEYFHIEKSPRVTTDWSICAGDIDADGFNDLMIAGSGLVSFNYAKDFGNDYQEVIGEGVEAYRSTFVDIDSDGYLDAFICNPSGQNHSYLNDGNGNLTFDLNLVPSPVGDLGSFSCTWTDYDNDGDLDLHLAKCFIPAQSNLLYNNCLLYTSPSPRDRG